MGRNEIALLRQFEVSTAIEIFSKWLERNLNGGQLWVDGNWLLAGPLNHIFPAEPFNPELCRQIAGLIESKGYCVETDVRIGSGSYTKDQSLALFRPFQGDSILPSSAYLKAADLLRLCVIIAAADDWIEPAKLDVCSRKLQNIDGLTRTDRKRLIILEQMLVQRLCTSSYYSIAKIIRTTPVDQRLMTAKLLVEVAVATNVITTEQRRVLSRVCQAFGVAPDTLDEWIKQIAPSLQYDPSKKSYWSLRKWRVHREGLLIGDSTLAQKRWNFTDWKKLNARWRVLHRQFS